jgi:hypothetical protein
MKRKIKMQYNDYMLTELLGLSVAVWGVIKVLNPIIKSTVNGVALRQEKTVPENLFSIIFQVLAFVLGIGLVATVDNASIAKLFYVQFDEKWANVDMILTGLFVGLNSGGIHWLKTFIVENGAAINAILKLKIEPPSE